MDHDEMQARHAEMQHEARVQEYRNGWRADYVKRVAFMSRQPKTPEARLHLIHIHTGIMDKHK